MDMVGYQQRRNWGSEDDDGVDWSDPRTWGPHVHRGHRLWAAMSAAFWIYVYKVRRCGLLHSHDWTACPYAHKGERARRRDLRSFPYLPTTCPWFRSSQHYHLQARTGAAPACVRGSHCRYAHGVFEMWLHPAKFRTVMCERGMGCPRRVCFFAHFAGEFRAANDPVPLVGMPPPPPRILVRAPPPPSSLPALSSPRRRVVVDHLSMQQQQQQEPAVPPPPGNKMILLSYGGAAGGASSSSSPPSPSPVAAVALARAVTLPALPQAAASPDDEDDDSSSDDGSVAGDYPHFDLIKDMI